MECEVATSVYELVDPKWVMKTHTEEQGFGWECLIESWLDLTTDHLLSVEAAILATGAIHVPVLAGTNPNGSQFLWDGHHRVTVAYIHDLLVPYVHVDVPALLEASTCGYPTGRTRSSLPNLGVT